MSVTAKEVVDFWLDAGPERWFERSEAFDDMCEMGFEDAHQQAAKHQLDDWMQTAEGSLALVILLDRASFIGVEPDDHSRAELAAVRHALAEYDIEHRLVQHGEDIAEAIGGRARSRA